MDKFKLIASIYLLYIRDNKILLLRRKNTGYKDGEYGLPSGHLEDGETLREGTAREAQEEIGINLDSQKLKLVQVMHRKENDIRTDYFFVTHETTQEPVNNEPHKCDDVQWFPIQDLPEDTIYYIKTAINNYLDKILYDEVGWGV